LDLIDTFTDPPIFFQAMTSFRKILYTKTNNESHTTKPFIRKKKKQTRPKNNSE